jgi:hypothetical protein
MMLDQRAWISVGLIDNQLFDGQPIQSPVVIGNTGKTPALKVKGDIVLQLLKPNETPTFIYGSGHPRSHIPEVTMLPNQQIHLSAAALQKVQGPNPDVILATPTIRKQLESENLLIAVHGNITYTDIFGLQHWVHFCSFGKGGSSKGPNLGAEKCDEYNDVDHDK